MKRNYFKSLFTIIVMVVFCFGFASCSNDEEASVRQKLVGIWKSSVRTSTWRVIEIKSDGSLRYNMWVNDKGEIWGYSKVGTDARWSYNEQDQTISMYSDDGYYGFTYKVNMAEDGKSWAGYTTDDKGKTTTISFTKLEGPVNIDTNY